MRLSFSTALAGWLAVSLIIAQSCAAPAQSNPPYGGAGSYPVGASGSPSGSYAGASVEGNAPEAHIDTTGYTADPQSSEDLTGYLKHHRLPLVGAQVLKSPDGDRVVVLYGFVGTDFGKHDAVTKAHKYLNDQSVAVDNRIKVEPALLASGSGSSAGNPGNEPPPSGSSADESAAGNSYPGVSSYEQQGNGAQQYAQQQSIGSAMGAVSPLLMLGLMALSATSGGAFMVGPGSMSPFGMSSGFPGSSPFGGPSYNPYPGFSSPPPYSSGGVNPYGGAGSPYSSAPPGGPYGP